jgi:hypothetical protein
MAWNDCGARVQSSQCLCGKMRCLDEAVSRGDHKDVIERIVWYLLACGPLVFTLVAWSRLCQTRRWPPLIALATLGYVTAIASLSSCEFLYLQFRPTSTLPPWEDPQILSLGSLFFLAPIGMILGVVAGRRGSPKWIVGTAEIASLPLLIVGLVAGMSV